MVLTIERAALACGCAGMGSDGCRPTTYQPIALHLAHLDLIPHHRKSSNPLRGATASSRPLLAAPSPGLAASSSIAALITHPQEVPHA